MENDKITNRTIQVYPTPVNVKAQKMTRLPTAQLKYMPGQSVKAWKMTKLPIAQLKYMPRQSMSSHWKNQEA